MAIRGDTTGAEAQYLADMLSDGARLLEIGCGEGRLTRKLLPAAASVVGADPALDGLIGARREVKAASFVCASGIHLPFRRASFDQALFALSL